MKILGIIPARYNSTRFPGKPLVKIGDKTMIEHVWNGVYGTNIVDRVVVATEDKRIMDAVAAFGGEAIMTGKHHKSGTDRCGEAIQKLGEDVTELVDYMNAIEQDMLRASKSENNSYKSAWEILVSCLTGTEFAKLANELSGMFKKNITEFKDAYGVFKVTADKQFDAEFEKMYEERKKEWDARHPESPLPELKKLMASRTASVRIAGILDYFRDFGTWVSKAFKGLAGKFESWINGLRGLFDKTEKADRSAVELIEACKKAAR